MDADFVATQRVERDLAKGYAKRLRKGWRAASRWEIAPYPAGNMYASVADLAKLAGCLLGNGANDHGRVLSGPSMADMMRVQPGPNAHADPRVGRQGLSVFLRRIADIDTVSHSGGWLGFVSQLLVAPERGLGVICLTNTSTSQFPLAVAEETLRALTGRPSGAAEFASLTPVTPDGPSTHFTAQSGGLNTNGRFLTDAADVELVAGPAQVMLRTLIGQHRAGHQLRSSGPGDPVMAYRATDGTRYVEVVPDAAGRPHALRFDGYVLPRGWGRPVRTWLTRAATAGIAAVGLGVLGALRSRHGRASAAGDEPCPERAGS